MLTRFKESRPATDEDYYALLGVTPDASEELIRQTYRRQAKLNHPDLRRDPQAEWLRRRLNEAREVLIDPECRRRYDLLRNASAPQRPPTSRDGFDVNETVTITLAHAVTGATYERSFHRPGGQPYTLVIPIPPGIVSGTKLLVPGAGVRGRDGGRDGDFVLTVWVA